MPDPHVNISLTFRTSTHAAVVLESVLTAIKTERRAGRPVPKVATGAAPPTAAQQHDPHVSISLTFPTTIPSSVVLENVLAAINNSGMAYELTGVLCSSFDPDELEVGRG